MDINMLAEAAMEYRNALAAEILARDKREALEAQLRTAEENFHHSVGEKRRAQDHLLCVAMDLKNGLSNLGCGVIGPRRTGMEKPRFDG